jgi:hypothetical protein
MISINFEQAEAENEYDTVISMDNKNSVSIANKNTKIPEKTVVEVEGS